MQENVFVAFFGVFFSTLAQESITVCRRFGKLGIEAAPRRAAFRATITRTCAPRAAGKPKNNPAPSAPPVATLASSAPPTFAFARHPARGERPQTPGPLRLGPSSAHSRQEEWTARLKRKSLPARFGIAWSYTLHRHLVMKFGCILASALLYGAFALPCLSRDWLFVTTNWNEAGKEQVLLIDPASGQIRTLWNSGSELDAIVSPDGE